MRYVACNRFQHVLHYFRLLAGGHLLAIFFGVSETSVGVCILGTLCLVHVVFVSGCLHLGLHDAPPLFKDFPFFVAIQCGYRDHLQCVA